MNLVFLTSILSTVVQNITVILTPDNHVSIKGPIDEYSASRFISKINKIDENIIFVYFDSPGGDVASGQKMIQYINYKKHTNKTVACVVWTAHSMAFNILQYCTFRYVLPDSKMMQHQISSKNINGNIENINSYLKITNHLYDKLILDASKRIGISHKQFRENINNDWYLYGQDIVDNNVADVMISSIGCSPALTKSDSVLADGLQLTTISQCPLI